MLILRSRDVASSKKLRICKIKTTEITRDNVQAGTQQFKLLLILLNLEWKYAVTLKLQNRMLKYEW